VARVLVAVSWPYASGPQHLGHLASTYVPADLFARFHRLRGDEVLMVSGSDMHGTPILVAAEKEGTAPSVLAERFHAINRDSLVALGVGFDLFTHTHTVVHERTVQEVFLALLEHGFVDRRTQDGPYCPKHRRFLPDRYLVGTCPHCGFAEARGDECDSCGRVLEARELRGPRCSLCGTPAEFRPSEHFYLLLDKLAPRLAEYIGRQAHWRPATRHVAEHFLEEGLHATSITRDLEWGVPIPLDGYEGKRFYVWFEALVGYLSATREWAIRAGRPDAWRRFWDERETVHQYYFMGKDNRFHHTIIWPGMLLGVGGYQLPYDVLANEWMTLGGQKVSRSRSRAKDVFVAPLLERYPSDVVRFYAALLAPQNHDTELNWDEFDSVREEVLANQYGNLVQRTLVLARDRYGGRIPPAPADVRPDDAPGGVADHLRIAHHRISEEYERVRLKEALDLTLEQVREANRRFHEARPWQAVEPERAHVLYDAIWRVQALATWLAPVMPTSSAEVFRMLGYAEPPGPGDWDRALRPPPGGQRLGEIRPLFPRADAVAGPAPPPPTGPVPLEIRVGEVRTVEPHPAADKLYVLTVDIGEATPRTVVAGLRASYPADALVGRRVLLLANLAPRTIRRMTSQGMILAADAGETAVVLTAPEGTPAGAPVAAPASTRTIAYEEFAATALRIGRVTGPAADGVTVDLGDRTVRARGSAPSDTLVVVRLDPPDAPDGVLLALADGRPVRPLVDVAPGAKVR